MVEHYTPHQMQLYYNWCEAHWPHIKQACPVIKQTQGLHMLSYFTTTELWIASVVAAWVLGENGLGPVQICGYLASAWSWLRNKV